MQTSLHRGQEFASIFDFFCLSLLTPPQLLSHDVDDFRKDDFVGGLVVYEGDRDASADYVVWLDCHFTLDRIKHFAFNEGVVFMQTFEVVPYFSNLNDS